MGLSNLVIAEPCELLLFIEESKVAGEIFGLLNIS